MADAQPTTAQWTAYQALFDWLNQELFSNELPGCLLNFSRHSGAYGFFAPDRWERTASERIHEISLNPSHIGVRDMRSTVSTLVHEMVHLWQWSFGHSSRRTYHNLEWAQKMESIGLMPSSTGAPGGNRTGQGMSHYILDGGLFARVFEKTPQTLLLPWRCRPDTMQALRGVSTAGGKPGAGAVVVKSRNKLRYSCPNCHANIWGKPNLQVGCLSCNVSFVVGNGAPVQPPCDAKQIRASDPQEARPDAAAA